MRATTGQRPAGPPAASVRPGSGGIGRSTSAAAERVSDDLRRGTGDFLEQRRWIAGLGTPAAGALGMVGLYQFGVLHRVPEPPLPFLNADAVDASGEAYQAFKTPDAALGLVSAGATLVLAGMGARDRARAAPWLPLACGRGRRRLSARRAGHQAPGCLLVVHAGRARPADDAAAGAPRGPRGPASLATPPMIAAELRETVIDGLPVRWLEAGEGHPVVLVHGLPTSPLLWRHVLPLVRGRCRAFEMAGYGTSFPVGVGRNLSLAAQADRLLRWVDVLGLEAPVLVGHDLGGGVAQIAAVQCPEACGGLVLTNAGCYDSWPIPSVAAMQRAASLLRHPSACPPWVVWGAADRFQKVSYGRRLTADLGTAVLLIPGGRHVTPEDHPEILAAAINDLLPPAGAQDAQDAQLPNRPLETR